MQRSGFGRSRGNGQKRLPLLFSSATAAGRNDDTGIVGAELETGLYRGCITTLVTAVSKASSIFLLHLPGRREGSSGPGGIQKGPLAEIVFHTCMGHASVEPDSSGFHQIPTAQPRSPSADDFIDCRVAMDDVKQALQAGIFLVSRFQQKSFWLRSRFGDSPL